MIVRQFLRWVQTAPAGERADATSALARAYLHSPLDAADRASAEAAMTVLLDDPSPLVREALARVLGPAPAAPYAVLHALAHDQGDIAAIVLSQSPIFAEGDLIDAFATGDWRAQCAVACRLGVPVTISGAIAEVGCADACLALLENPGAAITPRALLRILERYGTEAPVRAAVLALPDLPAEVRHAATTALAGALTAFAAGCGWLGAERAARVCAEASDKATVVIAADAGERDMRGLVVRLRESGQLTPMLVLRALLSGQVRLFEEALSDLSGLPLAHVSGLVHARRHAGLRTLYERAGLPHRAFPAFRAALDALAEQPFGAGRAEDAHLSRRMIERVLTSLGAPGDAQAAPLLMMLRRLAAEAARDEARAVADDLVRDIMIAA